MWSGLPEESHDEIRKMIESHLTKLKDWLDTRLQKHEDILRCLSDASESRNGFKDSMVVKDSIVVKDSTSPQPSSEAKANEISSAEECVSINVLDQLYTETLRNAGLGTSAANIMKPNDCTAHDELRQTATNTAQPQYSSQGSLDQITLPGTASASDNGSQSAQVKSPRPSFGGTHNRNSKLRDSSAKRFSNMSLCMTDLLDSEWHSKLMDVFDQLDLDRSGSIDRTEFMEAFEEVGMPGVKGLTVFKFVDKTENGVIDRIEWLQIIEKAVAGSDQELNLLAKFLERLAKRQRSRGKIYETDRTRRPCLILRHDSLLRMCWDCFMMILLLYISISMPFSLGFGQNDVLDVIDRVFDMFFCFDVILNFRTSYLDRDETVVVDGCLIAKKYLKSWFLLDFVSSVPFDLITAGLLPNLTPARLLKIGKIAKVMKLLRLSKMMSVMAESELMEKVDEKSTSRAHQTFVRITKLVCMAFLVAHWLACFGAAVDSSSLDYYFANEVPEATAIQRYLAAMYWAMTTLSTVGYGDITPKTDGERAYAMIAMIVGGALYGYVIGSVTSIVTDMDLNARAFHERMELVQSWLDRHDEIPKLLRRRLRKHFKRTLASKAAVDDSWVVSELSPELRADTAFFLINAHVRHHPMFSCIPNSALAKIVEVLHKSHAACNEFVVKFGDPGIAMYVLVEGVARYDKGVKWYPNGVEIESTRFEQVAAGDSFGEEILFGMEESYLYSIVTITNCEFHYISEDGFQERFQNMPDLQDMMKAGFLQSKGSELADTDLIQMVTADAKRRETNTMISSYQPSAVNPQFSANPYRSKLKMPRIKLGGPHGRKKMKG